MVDHELALLDHTLDPLQTDEGLINGVNLLSRPETGGHTHHPIADVTVQREVGRQGHHPGFFGQMPELKPGRPHLDAQGLGLIAAGDGTTVIVGQDDQGPAVEAGSKHPLTAAKEVVPIDQGVQDCALTLNLDRAGVKPGTA